MPEFRNRPEKYPVIGALGKALQKVDEFARAPGGYSNPPVQMISDFLDIPGIYKTAENINYGSPLTRGTGQARQMTDDTKAGLFGAMNFAPGVAALAKAAKPLAKAAAPYAARHAVNVAEKYGVSPTMYIVKPEGNLNFRHSVIAEHLKGPEKQKVGDFIKQVKGMQGLTKEGKKAAMVELEAMDPNTVVTKQFIEDSFTPSKYSTIDLAGTAEDAELHMDLEATERALRNPDRWYLLADELDLDYDNPSITAELERLYSRVEQHQRERGGVGDSERFLSNMSPRVRDALTNSGLIGNGHFDHRGFKNAVDEVTTTLADTHLEQLRDEYVPTTDYMYEQFQRLNANTNEGTYTEKGLSHPDAPELYGHYSGATDPLVAHFRGTSNPTEIRLPTAYMDSQNIHRHKVKPNSFLIEELQSDAQKGVKQEGPLHQAHATAFKAAVQHALEQGHNTVYLPSADTIGYARGKSGEPFAPIYNQEVVNYGLGPLSKMEGVNVTPIISPESGRGVSYHEIDFSPEAIEEILSGKGQAFPGFAVGGAVGMKEGGKPERTEDRQSFKATPRSGTLGKIADATKYLHENYLKAQGGYSNPVTDAISNLAGVPAFADMILIGGKPIRRSELQEIADQVGYDLSYAEGIGGKNHFNDMSRKDPSILSESDKMMLDAIRDFTPPEMKGGGSVNLRSHYLGTPMMQVGHRIGSRAIEAPVEGEDDMPEMPKNPTPEQNAEFTRSINEYFKKQADKKYWEQRGPNSADERESRFGELTQSDDPINIEVPPKFGVTSIPLAPEPEEIEEKKSSRYYADGGTVNLRAHYLGN